MTTTTVRVLNAVMATVLVGLAMALFMEGQDVNAWCALAAGVAAAAVSIRPRAGDRR